MHDDGDDDDDDSTKLNDATKVNRLVKARGASVPCLIVVKSESSSGRIFKLRGEMVIGRKGSSEIWIDEDGISRRHARLRVVADGAVEIEDLGSTNGTFCNGERVTRHELQDGDKLQIGSTTILKFSYQDALDEEFQANLYESAARDALTGAHNKRVFTEALRKEFAYAKRHRQPVALVMFDVDHFKRINDSHGHPCGDYVLQRLAQTVAEMLRAEDGFARYGGEEFVLLLRETPEDKARQCAERVRTAVAAAVFAYEGATIPVTISLGLAVFAGSEFEQPEELVEAADRALYAAKHAGRNCTRVARQRA